MSTNEERMKILQMVADGTLSPEEAARLLDALDSTPPTPEEEKVTTTQSPRWLRIRVTDLRTDTQRVNIRVPWLLVKFGLKLGGRVSLGGTEDKIKSEEVTRALEQAVATGEMGKIIDVQDAEDQQRVEIFLE